ncbi:MAG: hypothetical protein DRP71_06710 [Verrucomicrobia bacterium]|nr:MAG: hypothetical protein DRP71_06710 [Verrucomicrobiota bacterium]
MKHRVWATFFLLSAAISLTAIHSRLVAEMIPNAPVENFRLPMFNDEGYRSWDLRGARGIYVDGTHVDVIDMKMRVFSGDEENEVLTEITSPTATVLLMENKAIGRNTILVSNKDYTITGQNWTWEGSNDSFTIEGDVVVTFFEGIGDILK